MLKTEEAIKMEPGSGAEYKCKYKPWVCSNIEIMK